MAFRTGSAVTTAFNYEELIEGFKTKLVTQLRGHSADNVYLETWVPDDDPVKSVLNMVESAIASGLDEMCIRFAATTMTEAQRKLLLTEIAKIAHASLSVRGETYELTVRESKS